MILGYVLDWYADPSHNVSEPLYIVEIGAGFGKLGFLIMYRLFEMKEHWPRLDTPPFVYASVHSSYNKICANRSIVLVFGDVAA